MDLVVEDDPDPEDLATLESRLADATAAATGHPRPRRAPARGAGAAMPTACSSAASRAGPGAAPASCCTSGSTSERAAQGLGTRLLDRPRPRPSIAGCHQVVLFTHAVHAGRDERAVSPAGLRARRAGRRLPGRRRGPLVSEATRVGLVPTRPSPRSLRRVNGDVLKLVTGFHKPCSGSATGASPGRGSGMPVLMLTTTGRKSGSASHDDAHTPLLDRRPHHARGVERRRRPGPGLAPQSPRRPAGAGHHGGPHRCR